MALPATDMPLSAGLRADVLVIGGGASAVWAAWSAARAGASVVLVDKGFCGTSGATAMSGNHVWSIPPVPELRQLARTLRDEASGQLTDHNWIDRVVSQTWDNLQQISEWGYPFPDENGTQVRSSLQGPIYMRLMRGVVRKAKVKVLDHSPALELLADDEGVVVGARGVRTTDQQPWCIRAGAIVLATGGCAFNTKITGTTNNTGDGVLMAVEAGAELSGMEFSNQYACSALHTAQTKGFIWIWATYYSGDGHVLVHQRKGDWQEVIARELMAGRQVYAQIDRADTPELRQQLRDAAPNFFLPYDRHGIDPFREQFPVTLRLEGTVRGTGGIRLVDYTCATSVPGLFAAGDASTREYITGGTSGGGSRNAAWAMSSGRWAGAAAAVFARAIGPHAHQRRAHGTGVAGMRSSGSGPRAAEVIRAAQQEVIPFEKNLFRNEAGLTAALTRLAGLWDAAHRTDTSGPAREQQRAREAAAIVANARWAYTSALERTESRGMHHRTDYPNLDPGQRQRILSGGLDRVWVKREHLRELTV